MNKIDITGRRYGRLTVLKDAGLAPDRQYLWECVCDCGANLNAKGNLLRSGKVQSCGCLNREKAAERCRVGKYTRKAPGESARNRTEAFYKRNAKARNLEWNLTTERFTELTSSPCRYCGDAPSKTVTTGGGIYTYNGIDRIDNALGYIEGNVVSCCRRCNVAKMESTVEEFLEWASRLYRKNAIQGMG